MGLVENMHNGLVFQAVSFDQCFRSGWIRIQFGPGSGPVFGIQLRIQMSKNRFKKPLLRLALRMRNFNHSFLSFFLELISLGNFLLSPLLKSYHIEWKFFVLLYNIVSL
jgi:hypothetical protein